MVIGLVCYVSRKPQAVVRSGWPKDSRKIEGRAAKGARREEKSQGMGQGCRSWVAGKAGVASWGVFQERLTD